MPTLPKFIIHLDRFVEDVNKAALLMEKYDADIKQAGFETPGFDFLVQSNALKNFPSTFRAMVDGLIQDEKDLFGNEYQGFNAYQFAELAVDSSYSSFTAIRLLGSVDLETSKQSRYTFFGTPNELFTPTTINIISDLRMLSDSVSDKFGAPGIGNNIRCGQDASGFFDTNQGNLPSPSVQSDLTWSDFVNTYILPKPVLQPISRTELTSADVQKLVSKYDSKSAKTDEEKKAEEAEWASISFKENVVETQANASDVVNASAEILIDPEGLASKIQTLGDAYSQILDKVSLGCLIKSAMECVIPPLSCKEILRGLRIDNIADKISLAFPNQPRLTKRIKVEIEKANLSGTDAAQSTDAFLNAIETFIDLEAICDAVNFASVGGFQIPTIELPELDIIDLFGSVEIAIEDAILSALMTSVVEMITGVLGDLASCDNLDAFVAGALNGGISTDAGLNGDLARLFADPGALVDPEKGAIASSLNERWEQFVKTAEPLLEEVIKVEAEGSLDVLGGAVQLQTQLDAVGGIANLRDAIEGNVGAVASRAIFESFFQGQIDFTQLLKFQGGEGADILNSLLAEIGRYEISADGENFTLERISDDQTVIIFSALGKAPSVDLNVNGRDLANSIGLLLDDVVAILSPGDVLKLLSGTPNTRTIEVIIELIKISHVQISFINKPDQIINLFKTLGDTTGTSNMKDGVILASNVRRTRNIPRKFCPEDDEAISLQEEILVRSLPPEEVRTIIDEIIEVRRIRYNDLGDILVRLGEDDFSPTEVLEPIICGLNPDGSRPAVVDDALDTTFNTMFESVKMAFDREIPKYPDTLSSEEKTTRVVPRTIKRSGDQPVFGGTENLFSSLSDFLGTFAPDSNIEQEVINPEWSALVSQGLTPPEDDGSTRQGRDELGPFTDGPPMITQDVVKRVGQNFKRSFRFDKAVNVVNSSTDAFEVQIKGSLPVQSPVQEYAPSPALAPRWNISYKEKDTNLSLALSAQGSLFSTRLGRVQFSDNFFFSEDFSRDLTPDVSDRVGELNELVSGTNSKPNIFSSLLKEKLRTVVSPDELEVFEDSSAEYFSDRYEEFIKGFLTTAGTRVANNRLLNKIPNRNLEHLGPGTSSDKREQTETLIINLINFSAPPTEAQRRCNADPHLLDLEAIKELVKDEYDKDCESESQNDGVSRSRSPINSSGFVGVVLTTIRLYVIEYVLRGLFVFDEYGYKTDFADDQLLISYVSFRIKNDLIRQGNLTQGTEYYATFERELKIAYESLSENEQFNIPSLPLPAPGTDGVPTELKILVQEQFRSVLEKVAGIVGVSSELVGENVIKDLLTNLPTLDTFSNFEMSDYTSLNKRMSTVFQPEEEIKIPFPPVPPALAAGQEQEGKYVVEKYIRIPFSTNTALRNQQQSSGIYGVVNFENWEQFLDNNSQEIGNLAITELFDEPWNYGYRLVFVSPIAGEAATLEEINEQGRKFKLGTSNVGIDSSLAASEKAYHILEAQPITPTPDEGVPVIDIAALVGLQTNSTNSEDLLEQAPTFKQFNTLPIAQFESPINDFQKMNDAQGNIEQVFENNYKALSLDNLSDNLDVRTLFDYCFFSKRLVTFMLIHSSMILNSEDMKFLFEGTKIELKKLFNILRNMGDYTSKSESQSLNGVPGNAGAFKADFDQIGAPGGPKSPDAFYLHSITPILILRGLAELIDPNIAITAKIVAAGNAGYLLPKFARNDSGAISLDATTGTPTIQFTPVGVVNPNDGFECVLRGSDDLPSFVEDGTLVDWKSPILPTIFGIEPPQLPTPGEPLFIPRGPFGELYGLDRSANAENPNAIVASIPEFPGESINLPYGLVSLALLPLQLFFPYLGPFSGPPYNVGVPLGPEFLKLEPLIYQLPNYKFAFEGTDVAEDILISEGIDLSGPKKFKCDDGTEPATETNTLSRNSNLPPESESC